MFIGISIAIKIESTRVPKAVIRIPVVASKLMLVFVCVWEYMCVQNLCFFMWVRVFICLPVLFVCQSSFLLQLLLQNVLRRNLVLKLDIFALLSID